ncbi:Homeodomain-like protein, partial [Rhizoclosmatium globosum]
SSSKKPRFRATPTELAFLLKIFESNPFPSTKFRAQIAAKLNLTERQVMFWFQNRRSSLR